MKLDFTTLDVFTKQRLSGNQVAIIRIPAVLRDQINEEQKQKIASEFNLSETVFLNEAGKDDEVVDYDIFTPLSRIAFAGHPTIGTAVYIAAYARNLYPIVHTLKTLAGLAPITFNPSTSIASIVVPHDVHIHATRLPHPLPSSAGGDGSPTVPLVSIVRGMAFNLVPLTTLEALVSVSAGLLPVPEVYRGLHLDAFDGWNAGLTGTFYYVDLGIDPDQPGCRFIRTRSIGSREDPGTGSASSALCCYLSLLEGREKGKGPFEFHLVQGVEVKRRCDIFVSVIRTEGGEDIDEVRLSGGAVKIIEGVIEVN
ncbi:phenazine biosynthesis-like protein [Athelia psychrophila]|uniref:Phenazine biosynthesis-like protein n=1 Tax=Athelia psychrophila TaxID=1759441 RepID=A0A166HJ38_9AGAM|nr:phenazine biosynthesis-like protein [Fibularhizoctonia sp. CBS 109695]